MAVCFQIRSFKLERVEGIEPSYSEWKSDALPLSYTRSLLPLGLRGDGSLPRDPDNRTSQNQIRSIEASMDPFNPLALFDVSLDFSFVLLSLVLPQELNRPCV